MSTLFKLAEAGQSIWLDFIQRSFTASGELQALIDKGIKGVTSNPTIFEKAINAGTEYDEQIRSLATAGFNAESMYEELVVRDITLAADLFRPVFESSNKLDGYVSLEVSPLLAHDTAGTVKEALRLQKRIDRPNVMIKVPATPEGAPAIRELIAAGINVNVTLLFNGQQYSKVVQAYLDGLEQRLNNGGKVNNIASVASFFVSRVDTVVDSLLEKKGPGPLSGTIAIAACKCVYDDFKTYFQGPRWAKLAAAGARVQRLLWASTGTKNSNYPDTLYVDELVGKETVNTLPPATLAAVLDHGKDVAAIEQNLDLARQRLKQLKELDIDLAEITEKLQKDGVQAFSNSFTSLMESIEEKARRFVSERQIEK
jgi:transaldolase